MKKIELVTVKRLFNRIDDDIHLVIGKMLGNLIPCTYRPTVALFQVGRTPRCVQMMNRHSPFLGIDTSSEHGRGAEQYTDTALVHGRDDRLTCLLVLALLYETDFISRNAVVLHQFTLDFRIDRPTLVTLPCTQIREYKLCSLLCIEATVVVGNHLGTVRSLVVRMVFVVRAYHTHIQRHLSGIVGCNEHLCLFLRLREWRATE